MAGERLIQVLLLAIIGLALMGLFRPDSPDPREDVQSARTEFFINKTHQKDRYDLLIVGDSRALRGLAPEIIEKHIPGTNVFNMAFHAGGLNYQMFAEAESLLDPGSNRKGIILAPTSLAFLPHKKNNSQFREYRNKPRDLVWLYQNHPQWAEFFQPLSPSVFLRRWFDLQPKKLLVQEFISTGWIATVQYPRDDVTDFSDQREILSNYVIDPTLIEDLISQTKTWVEQGIAVFALFPPAYSPRVAMEDSLTNFNPRDFRHSFETAGGIWLDVEGPDYVTYDGSHLEKQSSQILSQLTGQKLAKEINR